MIFGKLFGSKKKIARSGVEPLSSGIRDSILQVIGERSIPSMPSAAQKAFQLSTDPKAEARDFIEVIESDESLSARVMKIANSVYFDRGHETKTIENAVVVIGTSELRALLNASALSSLFPSRHPARSQLWANDVATGIISRLLAKRLLPGKEDICFLGGLMHDMGKLLLLQRAQDDFVRSLKVWQDGGSSCEAEESVFVFNHTEVGQFIAERWNFGPDLVAMIRGHHQIDTAESEITPVTLIHAADLMAHALGLGHPAGYSRIQKAADEALQDLWPKLGFTPEERKSFLHTAKLAFEAENDL